MGTGSSQPQYQDPNYVMDFHFRLFKPGARAQAWTAPGPAVANMQNEIGEEILLSIQHTIANGDRYNASLYKRYMCTYCWCILLSIPWYIIPAFIVFLIPIFIELWDEYRFYSYAAITIITFVFCMQMYCCCCSATKGQQAAINWRENIIKQISEKTQEWQCQWPQFSMTIIYPIIQRGRKGKTVDIRGTLRVSVGAPQVINAGGPVYQQYLPQPQAELVTLNGHQRNATPLIVQGANGQQVLVQGQPAIINGQQVVVVPQPQVQMQPQPHIQYQPQPAPEVALSTHSALHHGYEYKNVPASAPVDDLPPYNPDFDPEAPPAEVARAPSRQEGAAVAATNNEHWE